MGKIPSRLYTPPTSPITEPPTTTRCQSLPFSNLSWENFEKLCYRLIHLEADVEACKQYGIRGQDQEGIDIYARISSSDKYRVFQCKNESNFGPAKIKKAVDKFVTGEWFGRSDCFVLCTRENLRSTGCVHAFEEKALELKAKGVNFISWDEEELSTLLKDHPKLVDDFFGRGWVSAFCGEEVAVQLGERLDAHDFTTLRSRLASLYNSIFNIHDRGIPLPGELPLYERYVVPDIEEFHSLDNQPIFKKSSEEINEYTTTHQELEEKYQQINSSNFARHYIYRLPIQDWVIKNKKNIIFGEPGSGKSTFLRFIALDLLTENRRLEGIAEKWGSYLPIWIPFALWTKVVNQGCMTDSSVKGIVTATLISWDKQDLIPLIEKALKDNRLLLLLDGLDEHTSNDAAKVSLNRLENFLSENDISVIATTRPHGFEKLGMKTTGWQQASIANFTQAQQRDLADIWFRANSIVINPSFNDEERTTDIERQVEAFFMDLSNSNELRELARNPLLLCLLISFHISNIRLPLSRFEAYHKLTDHLISIHPKHRRVAAETPSYYKLSDEDLKKALAHLAYEIHTQYPEGLISEEDALISLIIFLKDEQQGYGMQHHDAIESAKDIISRAQDSIGIIVKRSQVDLSFYHRTFQDYLVSYGLNRQPFEEQIKLVAKNFINPHWREVILGLLQITNRPVDINRFIQAIREKSTTHIENTMKEDLLSEIAFGNFNCSPNLSKELGHESIHHIEYGTWMPRREILLKHALNGLNSIALNEVIKSKIREWFPCRTRFSMPSIFEAMGYWEPAADVIEALFRGLNAEEYQVKIAAAVALSTIDPGNSNIAEKLIILANNSDDPDTIAASVVALINGWNNHPSVNAIINRSAVSVSPKIALAGIRGRIKKNIHTRIDLLTLLKIAKRDYRTNYNTWNDIAKALIEGWPADEEIKKTCLNSIARFEDRQSLMVRDIAIQVLFEGYPMDDDVVDYFINDLESDQHPHFITFSRNSVLQMLAKNFQGHTKLIEALDKWAEKLEKLDFFGTPAALVGKTPTFKKKLLEHLDRDPAPHWAVSVLLEGWGMEDSEVSNEIDALINSGAEKASRIAHLLPIIIPDRRVCREKLVSILKDADCLRYDFVMDGLIQLGVSNHDSDVIDIVLPILDSKDNTAFLPGLKAGLIMHYNFDPRIRNLALQIIQERDEIYWIVARAFGSDAEIRAEILKIANPLPSSLRQIIATYLSEVEVDDTFALSVLELYDYEIDPEVKVQASIGYHAKIKDSFIDSPKLLENLKKTISCVGPDHVERRLAAFCGLTILKRLDIMLEAHEHHDPNRKVSIDSLDSYRINVPHIQFLLKNWSELREFFKEDFWDRLFRKEECEYLWSKLARFADEYPTSRQEALDFFSRNNPKTGEFDTLYFLSRAAPASNLLSDYCLNTLGLIQLDNEKPNKPDFTLGYLDTLPIATEILRDNFGHDQEFPKLIFVDANKRNPTLLVALSEAWPHSSEFASYIKDMPMNQKHRLHNSIFRYYIYQPKSHKMYRELLRLIKSHSVREYYPYKLVVSSIMKRLKSDAELISLLLNHLNKNSNASEKVSLSKLIYSALGLTPDLKNWAECELERQFSCAGIDIGFDITTGEVLSVPHVVYELLRSY